MQKAKLGPDHPDTLKSMNNLAGTYSLTSQHDRATRLFAETLVLAEGEARPRPPRHPHDHGQPGQ